VHEAFGARRSTRPRARDVRSAAPAAGGTSRSSERLRWRRALDRAAAGKTPFTLCQSAPEEMDAPEGGG